MYCFRCRKKIPPHLAHLPAPKRACACPDLQSEAPRSQSVPPRFRDFNDSTTLRSRSARRLSIFERRTWYAVPLATEEADAVNVDSGEPQPPVSSCGTGIYKKLDESKRQIRVLELHPGSGEEPISGNLITVDLPVLPLDFEERIFYEELGVTAGKILRAVRVGNWVLQDDIDRWESIQDSLIRLHRYRLLESYGILRNAQGSPPVETVRRLEGMRLWTFADMLQTIPIILAKALLSHNAHHSWTYDLNGLIGRLSAQGTRNRNIICRFAVQMQTAVDKFVSEGSDGGSALTSVDVPEMENFLAKVDMEPCIGFFAVSWFWGDVKPGERMDLDGRSLEVPRNAIRALRDLRHTDLRKRLWIDAVCINQDDKAERASQILLMGDIYSFAELTYVWLGHDNDDSVMWRAMMCLKEVLELCQQATGSLHDVGNEIDERNMMSYFSNDPTRVLADPGSLSDVSTPSANTSQPHSWMNHASSTKSMREIHDEVDKNRGATLEEWRSIILPRACHSVWPLFEFPWFNRLWVFQEAALARYCEVVFSTKLALPWKDLEDGAYLLKTFPDAPMGLRLALAVQTRRLLSDTIDYGSPGLLELVDSNVNQECSDPRDYIFGVLGLTVWAQRRLKFPKLIQPSYVKPVSDCMRDATRVMMYQEGDLSPLLKWCQVGQSPTWAVHWHRHRQVDILERPDWPDVTGIVTANSLHPGPLDLDLMEGNADLNVLLVKGLSVGIVHSTTPLLKVWHETLASELAALERILQYILDLSTRTGFEFSSTTITLTLMTCGYKDLAPILESEGFRMFEYVVSRMWDELQDQGSESCLDLPINRRYLFAQFRGVYRVGKLFATPAGQLCVGPEGIEEGDRIVRLFGLHVPVILRPEQTCFTFVGLAYIDMEFPGVPDIGKLSPEIFEIR